MNNSKSNDNFYCLAKNCLETTPPDSYSISMPASVKALVTLNRYKDTARIVTKRSCHPRQKYNRTIHDHHFIGWSKQLIRLVRLISPWRGCEKDIHFKVTKVPWNPVWQLYLCICAELPTGFDMDIALGLSWNKTFVYCDPPSLSVIKSACLQLRKKSRKNWGAYTWKYSAR